jgi:hypothetical protein
MPIPNNRREKPATEKAPTAEPWDPGMLTDRLSVLKRKRLAPRDGFSWGGRRPARFAPLFVWVVWGLMTLLAFAFVGRYGSCIPFYDEWSALVRPVTGLGRSGPDLRAPEPATFDWFWGQHNAHRIPLIKLILLILYKMSGFDVRTAMVLSAITLSAMTAALIHAAKFLRGRTSYYDAFFPLVILHWGHGEHLLWGWQIAFTLPVALVSVLLVIMGRSGSRLPLGAGILAGVCLLLLPLCGAMGLAYVPALAVWLGYAGVLQLSSPCPWRFVKAFIFGSMALAALALLRAYFIDWESYTRPCGLIASVGAALQLLALNLLPAAGALWPFSGFVVFLLLLCGGFLLGYQVLRGQSADRVRAMGLLFFLGGIGSLALGFGWGRGVDGVYDNIVSDPFSQHHYSILPVPAFCWLFLAAVGCRFHVVSVLVPFGLFVISFAMAPFNMQYGLRYGREFQQGMAAFESDLRAGEHVYALVARHAHTLNPGPVDPDWLIIQLYALHDQSELWGCLGERPPVEKVLLLPVLADSFQVERTNESYKGGAQSYLTFSLPKPMPVYCIRFRCAYQAVGSGRAEFWIGHKESSEAAFPPFPQFWNSWPIEGEQQELVAYLEGKMIDQVRLYPHGEGSWVCNVQEIELWVAASDEATR